MPRFKASLAVVVPMAALLTLLLLHDLPSAIAADENSERVSNIERESVEEERTIDAALAKGRMAAAKPPKIVTRPSIEAPADPTIVVVGSGLAGLSAALSAHAEGVKVVLLDKESRIGGNSAKATSGISAAFTPHQQKAGVTDSVRKFVTDTEGGCRGKCDGQLVRVLVERSADAVRWLESQGKFELSVLSQLGGHDRKRTHRFPDLPNGRSQPVGWTIVSALKKRVEQLAETGDIDIRLNSELIGFLLKDTAAHENTEVQGVEYTTADGEIKSLAAGAVVLATGGYAHDLGKEGLLRKHSGPVADLPTTNGPWATGQGVKLAMDQLDASAIDMDQVQVHPTSFVDPSAAPDARTHFLAPEALRGSGGILLTRALRRFVNELAPRDAVTGALYTYCADEDAKSAPLQEISEHLLTSAKARAATALLVLDQDAVDVFGGAFAFYWRVKKFFTRVDGVDGLLEYARSLGGDNNAAAAIAGDPMATKEELERTFRQVRGAALKHRDDAFGRKAFSSTYSTLYSDPKASLYVARVTPALHYTMGGLAIEQDASVIDKDEETIDGLYAAGEVSGGVHGGNRLGGNSLLECTVFGRIAGENAAMRAHAMKNRKIDEILKLVAARKKAKQEFKTNVEAPAKTNIKAAGSRDEL